MVSKSYEYPIVNVAVSKEMSGFGLDFKEDNTSVQVYGEMNPDAIRLMDRVGWK